MRRRSELVAMVLLGATLVAGCTTVPSSSVPQVVNRVGGAARTGEPAITPTPGADQRTIVAGFLKANATTDDPSHVAARGFLTPEARTKWQDSTVTVLDNLTINIPVNGTVAVSGRQIGKITATGTYTPTLTGDGSGAPQPPYEFGMKQVNGQWRIDHLSPGVLIDAASFELFPQRELYFFDLAEHRLVPDLRYSAISQPGPLATWLLTQLVGGPRPELQNAVTTEFPAQLDPSHVTVTVGPTTVVDIPGASQLDGQTRSRLADQLAATLVQVSTVNDLMINNSGKAVSIPQTKSAHFSAGDFQSALAPPISAPSVYYIRNSGVVDEAGRSLPAPVGTATYGLTSVAVASGGTPDLRVAGVTGSGAASQLLVGTVATGLKRVALSGGLSRPAWAPGLDEVWVGDGTRIVRLGADRKPAIVVPTVTSGQVTGNITALRLSPEGSRIAVVITTTDASHTAQVWVGSVVRTAAQVRIDALEPITPSGIAIKDVAWNDPSKLFVIGRSLATDDTDVYEVQVDGSRWKAGTVANLPQAPDTITVAANEPAWVSAGNSVWFLRAGAWASPGENTTAGINPVYLE